MVPLLTAKLDFVYRNLRILYGEGTGSAQVAFWAMFPELDFRGARRSCESLMLRECSH